MTFSEKLVGLRRKAGLSQEELASRLEVSRQAVSKWESGQTLPDLERAAALSRLFGVSLDYLLKEELEAPEAPKVGKYGMLRRSYLQTHRNAYYTGMLLSGRLNAHLEKIDRQATEMVEQLMARMAREQGVTEELKASDQMKWVGLMNNIRAAAEEMALTELVYTDV